MVGPAQRRRRGRLTTVADCSDRIAELTVERTLEPLRAMRAAAAVSAITVRVHSMKRRFELSVRRQWPRGTDAPPAFAWELAEVEVDGTPAGGVRLEGSEAVADPEEAYWIALEAIADATPASPAPRGHRGDGASTHPPATAR